MQRLDLTAEEVLTLTDRVANADYGVEEQRVVPCRLLLKLGSAYVELVGDGAKQAGTLPLTFSEPELWLLRSKINSNDKMPNDPLFGVKLLTKLYRALLAEDAPVLTVGAEAGQGFGDWEHKALATWKERPDAGSNPDPYPA